MIVLPKRLPIVDASQQPKVLAPQKPLAPKPPCNFCKETRAIVRGVVENALGKFKRSK